MVDIDKTQLFNATGDKLPAPRMKVWVLTMGDTTQHAPDYRPIGVYSNYASAYVQMEKLQNPEKYARDYQIEEFEMDTLQLSIGELAIRESCGVPLSGGTREGDLVKYRG